MPGKRRQQRGAQEEEVEAEVEAEEAQAAEASASSGKKRKKAKALEALPAEMLKELEDAEDEEDDEDEEIVDAEAGGSDEEEEEEPQQQPDAVQQRVFRPGVDELEADEQLQVEPGVYDMLHKAQVEWPCLSFDVIRDDLGAQRSAYPMTAYIVAGTQAENTSDNRIYMMKWSNLRKTAKDGKEESDTEDDDEDSDEEGEAVLDIKSVVHPGGVNRIRSMPQACQIVATWADTGKVHLWNLDAQRKALDKPGEKASTSVKPIFTCEAHKEEGYAIDFNPKETGSLLTGSNDGQIMLWAPVKGGWNVEASNPFCGHTSSIEDVQWKRAGSSVGAVFASASADGSARIWDVREANRSKCATHIKKAHSSDVNVLSWSPCVGELLATAGDDGAFKVWDTRNISAGPMANFSWHKKPITSIDWHPTDETTLMLASEDSCVSIWDMAVEDDRNGTEEEMPGTEHYPAQLMFVHQGQKDPKEVRWHPQLPGVGICTAGSGFNIFKTCNM